MIFDNNDDDDNDVIDCFVVDSIEVKVRSGLFTLVAEIYFFVIIGVGVVVILLVLLVNKVDGKFLFSKIVSKLSRDPIDTCREVDWLLVFVDDDVIDTSC